MHAVRKYIHVVVQSSIGGGGAGGAGGGGRRAPGDGNGKQATPTASQSQHIPASEVAGYVVQLFWRRYVLNPHNSCRVVWSRSYGLLPHLFSIIPFKIMLYSTLTDSVQHISNYCTSLGCRSKRHQGVTKAFIAEWGNA
jgi:hypothetical protein